nr:alanine racemase [Nocardia bovistercoris]
MSLRRLGPEHKGVPAAAWGRTVVEFLDTAPGLDAFQTPLLTLDRRVLDANLAVMGELARRAGVRLAPHGKTTMAPRLWAEQLAAGCWGITVATVWQAQVARMFGVRRLLLANELVDPVGLRWVAEELARDPLFEFVCWADSVDAVEVMAQVLESVPGAPRLRVLVELGGADGRTGARGIGRGRAVADAIRRAKSLVLAGVGGYEGVLGTDRGPTAQFVVRGYLDEIGALHRELAARGWYEDSAIVTAGGSAYQDLVIERLADCADAATTVILRSGAYLVHDDGFYADISPLSPERAAEPLRSAMHGWARVVSRPEPGLALLDAGKRDLPYDKGLPVPQLVIGSVDTVRIPGAAVTELNDQHAYMRLPADAELSVGDVVRLGLSHPCTAFDKWRLIPVVDDADALRPRVIDLVHTFF